MHAAVMSGADLLLFHESQPVYASMPGAGMSCVTPIKNDVLYIVSIAVFFGILARLAGIDPIFPPGNPPGRCSMSADD
jgi:hypothetical protein